MHKDLSYPTRATLLVSAGRPKEPGSALNVPLVPASNFIIGGKHEYARDDGTPTWGALEEIVGGLESGQAVEAELTLDHLRDGFLIGNALRGLVAARLLP